MYPLGQVERDIYKLRLNHPLVIPQLDPDPNKNDLSAAKQWFKEVKSMGISVICIGGSIIDTLHTQKLLDIATKVYDLTVTMYLSNNVSALKGINGRTGIYWMQVPNSPNTLYGWDGLISNSLYLEKNELEPLPTIYVFDDRDYKGTANWVTRSYAIPSEKPEISLAVAKAAQYSGIRFYIMAGGSGSPKPPPIRHVEKLAKNSELFIIPTSGITTAEHAKALFSAGADAIHIGNLLEDPKGFRILNDMVKISKNYPGKAFL